MNTLYPAHLYDPTRRRVALELVAKEFAKGLLPSTQPPDLQHWEERLDEHTFWGAIEGIMGGALLKPMVHLLTAANYHWEERTIPLDTIELSAPLAQLQTLPGVQTRPRLRDVVTALRANPTAAEKQRQLISVFSRDEEQNAYRIITKDYEDHHMVLDGNRRALRAVLLGQHTIQAWHCHTNGQAPRDFWVPIDDMLRLVQLSKRSQSAQRHVQALLGDIFASSRVARLAYEIRIIGAGTPGAAELLQDA